MSLFRRTSLAAVALAVPALLVGCSPDNESDSTQVVTSVVDAPEETTQETTQVTETTQAADQEAPCEVSGYTDEARNDLTNENVTEDEVADVVANGCQTAKWDEDGYFEITQGDIDVDIQPDGLVREVDR